MPTAFNPFNPFASLVPGASFGAADPFATVREAVKKHSAHPDVARVQSHARAWGSLASKGLQAHAAFCQRSLIDTHALVLKATTEATKIVLGGPARLAELPDFKTAGERVRHALGQARGVHAKHLAQAGDLAREALNLGAAQAHEHLDALEPRLKAAPAGDLARPALASARTGIDSARDVGLGAVARLQGLARQAVTPSL